MKNVMHLRNKCGLLAFLVILLLHMSMIGQAQTKRGLIVAIGDYPESGQSPDWRDISSVNDIPLIRSALQKQGFKSDNISVIKEKAATKKGIVNAIKALTKACQKGDIVVLHFSSHGQQIEDDNKDEIDGFDEAIVPYGAPAAYKDGYDFSQHLRDDEIESLLMAIRLKVGSTGDVIMFADACHSGTVSRGIEKSRGGLPAMKRPNYTPTKGTSDVGVFQSSNYENIDMSALAPLVVISGAQASQVNYEYKGAGSLSTAISRSIDKLNSLMTYRGFFAQIIKEMSVLAPDQRPVIEGNIDRVLFAGRVIEQSPFYKAYKVRDNTAFLYGGKLNGIFKNAVVEAHAIGTTSPKGKPALAKGKCIIAEGTWCKIEFDQDLELDMDDYWFFVTEKSFGDLTICVNVDIRDKQTRDKVTAALSASNLISVVKEAYDFVIEDGGRGTIDIIRATNNKVHAENLSSSNNYKMVLDTLKAFARGAYMKNLELSDPKYKVIFEFIPVRFVELPDGSAKITDTLTIGDISVDGVPVFNSDVPIGIIIKVTNIGENDAYYSIIDIQPDGGINGILPAEDKDMKQSPEDFKIKAGQSFIAPGSFVRFYPPVGLEVFKLFASKEPIDFTPILTQKPRTRSYTSQLENLFADGYKSSTRGGVTNKVRSSSMESSTTDVGFEIR